MTNSEDILNKCEGLIKTVKMLDKDIPKLEEIKESILKDAEKVKADITREKADLERTFEQKMQILSEQENKIQTLLSDVKSETKRLTDLLNSANGIKKDSQKSDKTEETIKPKKPQISSDMREDSKTPHNIKYLYDKYSNNGEKAVEVRQSKWLKNHYFSVQAVNDHIAFGIMYTASTTQNVRIDCTKDKNIWFLKLPA